MKSGTARTVKTLVYLSIVAGGAYWAYGNLLPILAKKLQDIPTGSTTTPTPTPTPATQAQDNVSQGVLQDLGTSFATGLQSLRQQFSDLVSVIGKGLGPVSQTAAAFDGDAEATLATYYDPARRTAAQAAAEAAFTYDPGIPTGHGSGAGRSWLDPEELKRRLALSEALTQGSGPAVSTAIIF